MSETETRPLDAQEDIHDAVTPVLETAVVDRRRRRSDDPVTALHYQLSYTRGVGAFDAVVLVDDSGCLVAGAGAWPTCEELAAFAPLLADRSAIVNDSLDSRIAELGADVEVKTVWLDGCEAVICGRGSRGASRMSRAESIERAADGCRRILTGSAA